MSADADILAALEEPAKPVKVAWGNYVAWYTWLVLAAGALLRLVKYFQGKDLWLDETMLAWNICTRGFAGLLRPLDLGQIAPAGYLWLLKALTLALGESEWVLRLPSLLAGLGVLALLPYVCRKLCPEERWVGFWAAVGVAFNPLLVDFSNQAKPYELDALAAVVVTALVFWLRDGDWSARRWAAAGVVFAVLPWFSFGAVFVLAGVGATTLVLLASLHCWREAGRGAAALVVSALSFGLEYALCLRGNPVKDALLNMDINQQYLRVLVTSPADFAALGAHAQMVFALVLGFPAGAAILSAIVMAFGAAGWVREHEPERLGWVLGPLVVAAGFSLARLYPLAERLLLFTAPGLAVLLGAGLAELMTLVRERRSGRMAVLTAAVVLFATPVYRCALRTVRPFNHEGITDVMRDVAAQPGGAKWLVVDAASTPTFNLYNRWRDYGKIAQVLGADGFDAPWAQQKARFDALPPGTRFWLILPETYIGPVDERRRAVDYLRGRALLLQSVERLESAAYLYEVPPADAKVPPK
jgi:4-amino-4-deoxy-L-arabinose transferase-like glycosyltransferase